MDQLFVFEKNIEVSEVMIIFRKQMYFVLLFSVDDEYIEWSRQSYMFLYGKGFQR